MALVFNLLAGSERHEIVVPSFQPGFLEPLLAVYKKSIAIDAKNLLDRQQHKISGLFTECDTGIVPLPDSSWYVNMNTPEDYRRYLKKGKGMFSRIL
jgi:molybdopterin-guanine dinucleotide biosynthesis protein A